LTDPDELFRSLGASLRRRRRRRLVWIALSGVAVFALLLVVWEAAVGAAGTRAAGYIVAVLGSLGALVLLSRAWRAPVPAGEGVALRLEGLFPQARGLARDALGAGGRGLTGARKAAALGWIARRGARLDAALAVSDRQAAARARRWTMAAVLLLAVATALQPTAARRAISAVLRPSILWQEGVWDIAPGDARLAYGGTFEGRASYGGPPAAGPIVLEWSEGPAAWRAETLAHGLRASWRWERLTVSRTYRLRIGPHASDDYSVEVGPPLAVLSVEARAPGGAWSPLAGRSVEAGARLEVRGRTSDELVSARVVSDTDAIELTVEESSFRGLIRPGPGTWQVELRAPDGRMIEAARFHATRSGEPFVHLLRPAEDPARLVATSAWIEVRAGSSAGVRALTWESGDGRRGPLGDPRGARDTTLAAMAPIAAGHGAGDTIRFRVMAHPREGPPVATAWRTAIVEDAATFRERAAEARDRAIEAVDRAADETRAAMEQGTSGALDAADQRLRAASDSLAAALARALGDPELAPETREELEAYRRMLESVAAAPLTTRERSVAAPDPAAAAWARSEIMREIAAAVARAELERARAAAADSLSRLAAEERRLAEETRRTPQERAAQAIGPRQEALGRSARDAARHAPEAAAERLDQALDRAQRELTEGDPDAAAQAQEAAAGAMSQAAEGARAEAEQERARRAARRAAVDRAAGETLFLADRQRAAVEGLAAPPAGPGEQVERAARQGVVTRGFERMVSSLVEGLGGRPGSEQTAQLLAQALYATRAAEGALASASDRGAGGSGAARIAADEAAGTLAALARALLLPPGQMMMAGAQGSGAEASRLANQLDAMAAAQQSIADAAARADESAGGNPEAAAAERQLGRELGGLGGALESQGMDRRALDALAASVEGAARRLERGLPGARTETELRSLARRFADLSRMMERREGERRAEAARAFVPADPPPLPGRATARRLDPEAALAPWAATLPRPALEPARRYLERLAAEGVRAPSEEP
jgi:hypothetical protein